ncbi:MAG: formylglycine-generating enzyme family protein [Phycisphaerae bacterium]
MFRSSLNAARKGKHVMKAATAATAILAALWLVLAGCRDEPPNPPPAQPAVELPGIDVDLGGSVTMKLLLVPAGEFMMGYPNGDPERPRDEGPQRRVVIAQPFYMSACEVTQEQYERVTGVNPSRFKGPKNPVETVNWDDAVEFCRKFSRKTGMTARIPTEAQWEYACRAGSATRFCYGDDRENLHFGDYAWYGPNSGGSTHPVAQKKPNAWGFYDMHGNVLEWCDQGEQAATGPASLFRPIRGGGWMVGAWLCASARRAGDPRTTSADHLGIRLVVDAPAASRPASHPAGANASIAPGS